MERRRRRRSSSSSSNNNNNSNKDFGAFRLVGQGMFGGWNPPCCPIIAQYLSFSVMRPVVFQ